MKNLSTKWQKLIVWLTGYLNIIAFVLAGGYLFLNTEDEAIKSSTKKALITIAIFAGLDILRAFIYNLLSLLGAGYDALAAVTDASLLIALAKAITFAVLFILDILDERNKNQKVENTPE